MTTRKEVESRGHVAPDEVEDKLCDLIREYLAEGVVRASREVVLSGFYRASTGERYDLVLTIGPAIPPEKGDEVVH